MASEQPSQDYETFVRALHQRFDGLSRTSKKIAVYITENPNDVAMLSVNGIANRCGVHASSFVRFAQAMGYTGFKDLQSLFHARLSSSAPGYDARVRSLQSAADLEAEGEEKSEYGLLRDLTIRDMAALQALLETVGGADLQRAVRLMEAADTVFLIGQLRSAPIVEHLRYGLTMLGRKAVLLDPGGGLALHMARTIGPRDLLLAVSFRNYATEVVDIAAAAHAGGAPVVAITDSTFAPVARHADVVFTIPEHDHAFSRSLAAPICLAQALITGLAARVQGNRVSPRIPLATSDD
jgi:DNA-binding MurR/RpiR family transcriptional regulator